MALTQTLASFLKMIRSIALSLLLLILIVWNFGTLNSSAREVIAMVPRIQQFEASGVKLVLKDETRLKAALAAMVDDKKLAESERMPEHMRRATVKTVKKLTGTQAERLLTVVHGSSHCDYRLATPKMRLYFASDVELEELGLVTTEIDPTALANEIAAIAVEGSKIGQPRSCYTLKFTDLGYNAKTVLVGVMRQALS
jgi:hypothetical protein